MCIRCFFWKILGTHIHRKGIDIDLVKAKEIQDMEPPKSDEELKSFMEKVSYIRRFILAFVELIKHFHKLMKKVVSFERDKEQQTNFQKVNDILSSP